MCCSVGILFVVADVLVPNGRQQSVIIPVMGRVTEMWLPCYLVLLSVDSKTR